ncbi:MAG: hypothetical protein U0798_20190 [Gemmataceae bacterium]
MSTFHENFQPDPELEGIRKVWQTAKPLLANAVVTAAPSYPEYQKMKVKKTKGVSTDPACPSARVVGNDVEVAMYSSSGNGFGDIQEKAWKYLLGHTTAIEKALRRKLFAWHAKQLARFRDEDLPHDKGIQKYWKVIENQVKVDDPSAVNHFFKLVGIGLADQGLDNCGFTSFEFQTGWDQDHGLGIVMHKNRVLAAGGITEIIGNTEIVDVIKAVQSYELDKGDYSLLKK